MLLSPWDAIRLFRLGIGVWIIVIAIQTRDWISGLLGVFFTYQAITNTGCCGSGGCYVPQPKDGNKNTVAADADYEEIK